MSESMVQMQRKLADVTAKLEKVEEELAEAQATLTQLREQIKVEWLPVVGFEGLYEVSSNGDIRNVRTGNKAMLDDILHLSELIGGMNAQRIYKMYGPQDAVVERGLRESLYEKKQKLLETITENWQPIITIDNVDLLANQLDVWSKKHGRIVDVTYGKETYGNRVGIVHQAYYDCNGPVFEIVTDATHWMVVKGPIEGVKG